MAVLRRPDLVARHLANYGQLVKTELSTVGASLALRAAAALVAVAALLLALGLTGIAVMLGVLQGRYHWVLVAVPGVAWLLCVVSALYARHSTVSDRIDDIHDELHADARMFEMIKEAKNG
jgi:hypothetical protein